MADSTFLGWPFFDDRHRHRAVDLERFAAAELKGLATQAHDDEAVDATCREIVRRLGRAGLLDPCCVTDANGAFDVRSLCLSRDVLARHEGLADFAFAMQGLGTGPISLFGTEAQRRTYLPPVVRGERIAAFALSEPEAGSDVGAIATTARRDGHGYVLNGTKTWISNGGIADHYIVFARTGPESGAKGLSAFVADAGTAGLAVAARIRTLAPHPLATLEFRECRVPTHALIGNEGDGFKIAMSTLDVFRTTVGAAALGFARRALDEAVKRCGEREVFGRRLGEYQLSQAKIADMAVAVDAAALLVYRSAWTRDTVGRRVTREASMAKLYATEMAQQVIDQALQLFGGTGVVTGSTVETLYREIRALRIYEGTSEVQRLVIANAVMAGGRAG